MKSKNNIEHIMIIDDEVELIEIYEDEIRQMGYMPHIYLSATDAVMDLRTKNFDLIISDIAMRDFTGFDLLTHLTESDKSYPPVLFISAYGHMRDIALDRGALELFEKPVDFGELKSFIRNHFYSVRKKHSA